MDYQELVNEFFRDFENGGKVDEKKLEEIQDESVEGQNQTSRTFKEIYDIKKNPVWSFFDPHIRVKSEFSNKPEQFLKPNLENQFNYINNTHIEDWGLHQTRNEESVNWNEKKLIFEVTQDQRDLFKECQEIPYKKIEELKILQEKCSRIRENILERKKKALEQIEIIMNNQVKKFDESFLEKIESRMNILNKIDEKKMEEKFSRFEVEFNEDEKPFSKIIHSCSDAFIVIFSFLETSELMLKICLVSSYFYNFVKKKILLTIRMNPLLLDHYPLHKVLKGFRIRNLIYGRYKPRRSNRFLHLDNYDRLSKLIVDHKDDLIKLKFYVLHYTSLRSTIEEAWKNAKKSNHGYGRKRKNKKKSDSCLDSFKVVKQIYELAGSCVRLENLFSFSLPSDMKNLKNLRILNYPIKLVKYPMDEETNNFRVKRSLASLIEYFSERRPALKTLKLMKASERMIYIPLFSEQFKGLKEALTLLNDNIAKNCENLTVLFHRMFKCFETYSDSFMEFITKIELVNLLYVSFSSSLHSEHNFWGGSPVDVGIQIWQDPESPNSNVNEVENLLFQKMGWGGCWVTVEEKKKIDEKTRKERIKEIEREKKAVIELERIERIANKSKEEEEEEIEGEGEDDNNIKKEEEKEKEKKKEIDIDPKLFSIEEEEEEELVEKIIIEEEEEEEEESNNNNNNNGQEGFNFELGNGAADTAMINDGFNFGNIQMEEMNLNGNLESNDIIRKENEYITKNETTIREEMLRKVDRMSYFLSERSKTIEIYKKMIENNNNNNKTKNNKNRVRRFDRFEIIVSTKNYRNGNDDGVISVLEKSYDQFRDFMFKGLQGCDVSVVFERDMAITKRNMGDNNLIIGDIRTTSLIEFLRNLEVFSGTGLKIFLTYGERMHHDQQRSDPYSPGGEERDGFIELFDQKIRSFLGLEYFFISLTYFDRGRVDGERFYDGISSNNEYYGSLLSKTKCCYLPPLILEIMKKCYLDGSCGINRFLNQLYFKEGCIVTIEDLTGVLDSYLSFLEVFGSYDDNQEKQKTKKEEKKQIEIKEEEEEEEEKKKKKDKKDVERKKVFGLRIYCEDVWKKSVLLNRKIDDGDERLLEMRKEIQEEMKKTFDEYKEKFLVLMKKYNWKNFFVYVDAKYCSGSSRNWLVLDSLL